MRLIDDVDGEGFRRRRGRWSTGGAMVGNVDGMTIEVLTVLETRFALSLLRD